MIKQIVTLTYRDDTHERFECSDYPRFSDGFYVLTQSPEEYQEIPVETIKRIHVKEVWRKLKI